MRFLLILFLFTTVFLSANNEADSLRQVLRTAKGEQRALALCKLAALTRNSSPDTALLMYREAYSIAGKTGSVKAKIRAVYGFGKMAVMQKKPDSAITFFYQARDLAVKENDREFLVDSWISVISVMQNTGDTTWRKVWEEAMQYAGKKNDQFFQGKLEREMGTGYYYEGNMKVSLEWFKKAIVTFRKAGDKSQEAGMIMNSGILMYQMGDFEGSLVQYRKAYEVFLSLGDSSNMARSLENIALTLEDQGKLKEALAEMEKALTIYIRMDNLGNVAGCKENMAIIYKDMGLEEKSLSYMLDAARIREKLGVEREMAISYSNLAKTYYEMKNYGRQIEYLRMALAINRKLGSRQRIAMNLGAIGEHFMATNNIDSAEYYYRLSLKGREETDDLSGVASCYNALGNLYLQKKKDVSAAREFYLKSLKIHKELGAEGEAAGVQINLGTVALEQKDYPRALGSFLEALSYYEHSGERTTLTEVYDGLALAYAGQGDHRKAYEYRTKYAALKDSLMDAEKARQISEMSIKFDSEKKEKDLALANVEIERKDEQVRSGAVIRNVSLIAAALLLVTVFFVFRNYRQNKRSAGILAEKNRIIEEKNKDITDSIRYARHIQEAILPPQDLMYSVLGECFVLYLPKDIVSGDFYWMRQAGEGKVLLAAVDCTGHGVPGAFMSVLAHSAITRVVDMHRITQPSLILNYLSDAIKETFSHHQYYKTSVNDGMDISMCLLDRRGASFQFAGAKNPLLLVRNGAVTELKGDKQGISGRMEDHCSPFTHHQVPAEKGDMIYLFSDGYSDQFGGPGGKKFKYRRLKELLVRISSESVFRQKQILEQEIISWRGNLEQVDDIMVLGVRV